jgi:phosphoglycerol transferase MdoB-like AlkP superfamily enzyme
MGSCIPIRLLDFFWYGTAILTTGAALWLLATDTERKQPVEILLALNIAVFLATLFLLPSAPSILFKIFLATPIPYVAALYAMEYIDVPYSDLITSGLLLIIAALPVLTALPYFLTSASRKCVTGCGPCTKD